MNKLFVVIALFSSIISNGQVIVNFAGGGVSGLGDGGPATNAAIHAPGSGVFDKYGNYFFSTGERVRRIDLAGIITTVAGTGLAGYNGDGIPATAAQLNAPNNVIVDTLDNLIIADANGHRIRKVNTITGIITTIAGTGIGGYNGDGIPATDAQLYDPQDMCFDRFGNMYIADLVNNRIRKINTSGIIMTYAGTGSGVFGGDNGPATAAHTSPWGICADDTGNVFVADQSFSRIRKINTLGIITTYAGTGTYVYNGEGLPATSANIDPIYPRFDKFGVLYYSDQGNNRIRKIEGGVVYTVAGIGTLGYSGDGGPATAAAFRHPSGTAFDSCNNIYIADNTNDHVRKVIIDTPCYVVNGALYSRNLASEPSLSIFPNPATSILTIIGAFKEVTISNILGQTVLSQPIHVLKAEIDISNLPPGVYLVAVSEGEGRKLVRKIIKN